MARTNFFQTGANLSGMSAQSIGLAPKKVALAGSSTGSSTGGKNIENSGGGSHV
jgi:hypothetical protein